MRQCPDCEEKDRVVIAGKIFCANCGTPWQAANVTEEAEYKKKMGLSGASLAGSNGQVVSTPAVAAGGQTPAASSNSPTEAHAGVPVVASPNPQPIASPTPAPTTPGSPALTTVSPPVQPKPSENTASALSASEVSKPPSIPQALPPSQPPASPPVNEATAVASNSQPAVSTPEAPVLPVTPPQPAPANPNPNPVSQSANNSSLSGTGSDAAASLSASEVHNIAAEMAGANLKSEIGSEIPSLDSNEESVLSDAEIKEMSTDTTRSEPVAQPPTPTITQESLPPSESTKANPPAALADQQPSMVKTANSTTVVNDVVAPQVATKTDSVIPSPPPAALPAKPTLPKGAGGDMMTVAGVTMSRDDALKLALGEEAVPESAPKPKSPARPTAIVMTVIGLALMGMFLWQSNYPDISVKLASLRAGLTASVPGFVPSGWSKAQALKTGAGSLSYELVKDGKALKIEQQKSDWDSQAVLEQHVLKRTTDYLALQAQGLTIYMYGGNQAAWVNQGTLYTISGDHGIEQDDIIRMATSL